MPPRKRGSCQDPSGVHSGGKGPSVNVLTLGQTRAAPPRPCPRQVGLSAASSPSRGSGARGTEPGAPSRPSQLGPGTVIAAGFLASFSLRSLPLPLPFLGLLAPPLPFSPSVLSLPAASLRLCGEEDAIHDRGVTLLCPWWGLCLLPASRRGASSLWPAPLPQTPAAQSHALGPRAWEEPGAGSGVY